MSGGGSVAGHGPALGPSGCVLLGLSRRSRQAPEQGQQSPVWGQQGDGCPLGLGVAKGLAGHPDHQGSAIASQSGGSATTETPGLAPRPVGVMSLQVGAPTSPGVFHSHPNSSRPWGDGASKSPVVESRGSSQHPESADRLPAAPSCRGRQGPRDHPHPWLAEPASCPAWRSWLCVMHRW